MRLFLAAAFAALLAVGVLAMSPSASQAGSRSADIAVGTKAYRSHTCKNCKHHRAHRRHRHKHHAHHRSHKRHSAHRRHARKHHVHHYSRHATHRRHARKHHVRKRYARHYSRHAHGARYHTRRPGYTFHYAGFWYASIWWVPVRTDHRSGRHLNHPEWCRQQYGRYYHARSNTYLASDGIAYRCLRPKGM